MYNIWTFWYQKFEYAIGHWLQKAAEHILGCVMCSPGCFSLLRGSALLEDQVIGMYTIKSKSAANYVQYDQGEDPRPQHHGHFRDWARLADRRDLQAVGGEGLHRL